MKCSCGRKLIPIGVTFVCSCGENFIATGAPIKMAKDVFREAGYDITDDELDDPLGDITWTQIFNIIDSVQYRINEEVKATGIIPDGEENVCFL